ncbi:hypothetical protein C8R45DRAFT_930597 [Mycena sanguinolenta]|nr:hypothetical protein C8R45DRAFT_930597 [Mycena sanguinolenta]
MAETSLTETRSHPQFQTRCSFGVGVRLRSALSCQPALDGPRERPPRTWRDYSELQCGAKRSNPQSANGASNRGLTGPFVQHIPRQKLSVKIVPKCIQRERLRFLVGNKSRAQLGAQNRRAQNDVKRTRRGRGKETTSGEGADNDAAQEQGQGVAPQQIPNTSSAKRATVTRKRQKPQRAEISGSSSGPPKPDNRREKCHKHS